MIIIESQMATIGWGIDGQRRFADAGGGCGFRND